MPDARRWLQVAARELVQLLMEVHGTGLERILELVFESGAGGEAMINKLAADPIVRHLLLLYSLHPDDLETRVVRSDGHQLTLACASLIVSVEQVGVRDGGGRTPSAIFRAPPHGSHGRNVRTIVEEAVYDLRAWTSTSLTILGLDENASGFVPLESLLHHPTSPQVSEEGD